jgi:DNA-3-methyladenine glycosylase II
MTQSVHIRQSISEAERHLARKDRRLAQLIARHGPCTIYEPPSLRDKSAFHALAWSIINQQLSVASARSIERRLLAHHPRKIFQHAVISRLGDAELRACGLSQQKLRYLRALCEQASNGMLHAGRLQKLGDEEVVQILTSIPGIGPWTCDMFLMFFLGRLDILPLGDLALRRAISITYNISDNRDTSRMAELGKRWAPYRTIASWYLWCVVD